MPTCALSVIVISYNTREMTLACLRSLRDETRVPYELIVVDKMLLMARLRPLQSNSLELC